MAIFDYAEEFPPPPTDGHRELIARLEDLERQLNQIYQQGNHALLDDQKQEIINLVPQVVSCPQCGMAMAHVLELLGDAPAMRELMRRLTEHHGDLPPLLFYQAMAEEALGNLQTAAELIQEVVRKDVNNYHVYLSGARILQRLGKFSESTAMANLAVYENTRELPDPFIILAYNFHATKEINRMLECFRRIEKIAGREALLALGPLWEAHKNLYDNLKKTLE